MSRICLGGLLSPSLYIITKNLFPPRWTKCFFLPLTECSLYLSEKKNKAEKTRKRKRVVICKQFSPPVAYQSTAVQAIIFPPKINARVLCVRVLCKTRRSFIRSFSRLSQDASYLRTGVKGHSKIRRVLTKSRLILDEKCRLYGKFASYLRSVLFFLV